MRNQNVCGRNVRRLRLCSGLGQDELGKQVGLGRDAIAKIEGGARCVTDVELLRFTSALRTRPEVLLGVAPSDTLRRKGLATNRTPPVSPPAIVLTDRHSPPIPVPVTLMHDLMTSPLWGKGSAKRPWRFQLRELGAGDGHIGALKLLSLPDGDGDIPLVVLGEENLSAKISEAGEVLVSLGEDLLSQDLAGAWRLKDLDHEYSGIRSAILSVRMR